MLHGGHKIAENCDQNPRKPVVPVSHLWGPHVQKEKNHKLRQKEFLNHSDFIFKKVQELQAFEKNILWRTVVHDTEFLVSENFFSVLDWDESLRHLPFFHTTG